jgi:hypothetical protein
MPESGASGGSRGSEGGPVGNDWSSPARKPIAYMELGSLGASEWRPCEKCGISLFENYNDDSAIGRASRFRFVIRDRPGFSVADR